MLSFSGEKKYVCHNCDQQFENPNPLKIHLALACDQLKKQELWSRLENISALRNEVRHKSLISVETPPFPSCTPFTTSMEGFKLELPTKQTVHKSLMISVPKDLSTVSTHLHNSNVSSTVPSTIKLKESETVSHQTQNIRHHIKPVLESSDSRTSAFRPYLNKLPFSTEGTQKKTEMSTMPNILSTIQPSLFIKPRYIDDSSHMNTTRSTSIAEHLNRISHKHNMSPSSHFPLQHSTTNPRNEFHHAAEMETLVSNLGRSKQGHLCIYCGKIYSRKYGLKIHIRYINA